ncbi:MAG: type II toxin-antitoxin system RelE/ParE family toxin [Emergencia sp.]|nr:type II toxin-antitoxin system RelE/ParE family toxin [Emergencia sp.]
MANKLHYSPEALKDLDEIWDYISFDLCSVDAAANTVDKIIDKVSRLEDFAEIGASLSSITDAESEYRFLVSGRYLIFYRISGRDWC